MVSVRGIPNTSALFTTTFNRTLSRKVSSSGYVQPAAVLHARYLLHTRARVAESKQRAVSVQAADQVHRTSSKKQQRKCDLLVVTETSLLFLCRFPHVATPPSPFPRPSPVSFAIQKGGCRCGCRHRAGSVGLRGRAVEEGRGVGRFGRQGRGARGGEGGSRASRQAPARGKGGVMPAELGGRRYDQV